jgi:hypothetical protein
MDDSGGPTGGNGTARASRMKTNETPGLEVLDDQNRILDRSQPRLRAYSTACLRCIGIRQHHRRVNLLV